MTRVLLLVLFLGAACTSSAQRAPSARGSYLFVWAGDSAGTASDFLGVIDADPASPRYGAVVASYPTGVRGANPHHTEAEMPASGHLLANGFRAGRTWLWDLTTPTAPRVLTDFTAVGGFSHPHTFVRMANGQVLATFQYAVDSGAADPAHHAHGGGRDSVATSAAASAAVAEASTATRVHRTGGLVLMDERGTLVRAGSAADAGIAERLIYPYSVLPIPSADVAVSTTTDMDAGNAKAMGEWVQFWRLSDLSLRRSIALPPGPRGDEHRYTGEPFLLPDGQGVYIHTFSCGLYLVRGAATARPTASFVHGFQGTDCGVPLLVGRWFLQTVPARHALVALDIADPAHPREVSAITLGDDEAPHWAAIDPSGRRVVVSSSGYGSRLFVVELDPATGRLTLDTRFRTPGDAKPGVLMRGIQWPHGYAGTAVPHGTVFSR